MSIRPRLTYTAALLSFLPLLTSCGMAIRYGASAPPGVDVAGGLTFAWNQGGDLVQGDARLQGNRFFEDRLHEAIEWELSLRGITRVDSSPDLMVHHHLTLEDHEMAQEVVDSSGYTTTEVYRYEEGTVVVHLVDVRTGGNFWIAWAQADIDLALRGPDNMRKWVYDIAGQMFKSWPVPQRRGR